MSEDLGTVWNARLSSSAGEIARGRALTKDAAGRYVLATTANLLVGLQVYAVSLDAGRSDQSIRAAHMGYVTHGTIGDLPGTGLYVTVAADGSLTRTATITSLTIGDYLPVDGAMRLWPGYQTGAGEVTSDATSIQGVAVTSASATRSNKLTGDGTNVRFRSDTPDFRDWSPLGNGSTSDVAKLREFLTFVGSYGRGYIPHPTSGYYVDDTIEICDDTASGNLRGLRLYGDLADPFTPTLKPTFICAVPCPTGAAADITAIGNGGSGQLMQTIVLGAGGESVTTATADKWVGRPIRLWAAATKAHNGEFFITSVPSDGVVTVYQPNTGAAGADANDGAIRWRIWRSTFHIAAREFHLEGFAFTNPTGRWGPHIEVGQPFRPGALSVIQWSIYNCAFFSETTTRRFRYGLQIAKQIVPRVDATGYSANGAGVPQVFSTSQVDTGDIFRCAFFWYDEAAICHSSPNAQSKEVTVRKTQIASSCRTLSGYGGIGYLVPRHTFGAGGVYSSEGSPHANFYDCSFGAVDRAVQMGGSASAPWTFTACYFESCRRIFRSSSSTTQPIVFVGGGINPLTTGSLIHPSRELFEMLDDGPLTFVGSFIRQADNTKLHGVFASTAGKRTRMVAIGTWFGGNTGWTGRRGRTVARLCGPYKFTSGDTATFSVDGGAGQNVVCTVANFTAAGVLNVDLNEVDSWQLGRLIDYTLTGGAAWGEYDNSPVIVETETEGTGGSINLTAAAGGWVDVDIPGGAFVGFVQTNIAATYGGWFDYARGSGSGTEPQGVSITTLGNHTAPETYSGTHTAWPEGTRHFGTQLENLMTSVAGSGSNITAVTGGVVTVAGAVMTVADTNVTARSIITLIPTNAAAVALGLGFLSARTAATSFAFTFPGAPAGTETYLYSIAEPT